MTDIKQTEFINADSSINTAKAMRAGHDARSEALRNIVSATYDMIRARVQLPPERNREHMPQADASFRKADQLRKTEKRNLKDMGITRQQANTAFYRQFAETRY